jgi:alpha-L-fucosidase 2
MTRILCCSDSIWSTFPQQMNSWFAEPLNVAETLDPLWNMISEMAERGKITALETYNISRGWVGHHNTGIWRDSSPIDAAFYGFWPLAPAWLLQHMYEHYAFNPDPESSFLKDTAYPLMKSLSEFYMDFLVEAPLDVEPDGYIVSNPSMSPEHGIGNYNDTNVSLTYG